MVCVFSVFGVLSFMLFKQIEGDGGAAAILIDATHRSRSPATRDVKLLGDWNWYLPQLARVAAAPGARHISRAQVEAPPAVAPTA